MIQHAETCDLDEDCTCWVGTGISFAVPGRAQPGGSKRGFARGQRVMIVDANPNVGAWKERVALVAASHAPTVLLDCALELHLSIFLQRPRGHFGTKGLNAKGHATPYPTSKPDATKLLRAIEDALTGIIWTDDARVVTQHVFKRWGPRDEVLVSVRVVNPI